MIMAGSNITSSGDVLKKVQEEYLYNSIRHPKPDIDARMRQLRIVYNIDRKQYSSLKRTLPYIVCGMFNPPYRRTENFAYIDRFVIDIDNLCGKNLSIDSVHDKISSDPRVMMCFRSPSEDGLKVMFSLTERCYDPAVFSVFYKEFLRSFSSMYNLEQVVDTRTSDVTRACFMSVDPNAFFNPSPEPVDISAFIDTENSTEFFDLIRQQAEEDFRTETQQTFPQEPAAPKDPDRETMDKIKAILNPKLRQLQERKDVYVPQEILSILQNLQEHLKTYGIQTTETISIQYGKKLRMSLGNKSAEVNLFYGKRGYTVAISPRNGTDAELNEITADLIRVYIHDMETDEKS